MKPITIWELLKETALAWRDHKAQRLAAALAYYTMFSLAPLLIILIGAADYVAGAPTAERQILAEVQSTIGAQGAQALQTLLAGVRAPTPDALTATIGGVALLFGASAMFNHLKDSLNTIWGVARRPGHGVRGFAIDRLLAFAMVLATAVVSLISLIVSAGLARAGAALAVWLSGVPPAYAMSLAHITISWLVLTLLFAVLYKLLPDTLIAWRDVWVGAAMTAALFVAGQRLIGLYLRESPIGSGYGVAGALIVVLVWVYCSAMLLFFGAELTRAYANRYGSRVTPATYAVDLTTQARAIQGLLRAEELATTPLERGEPASDDEGGDDERGADFELERAQ
ncbi:MAG: YihY/virulence factor BrkB family protein [Kouleothrix sp.]|nr:YihY/virulence factor BrkB family protein [Kouleothrix sp.]